MIVGLLGNAFEPYRRSLSIELVSEGVLGHDAQCLCKTYNRL